MENIPKIVEKNRIPLEIKIHSYLMDHKFMGKTVLPAVEAMEILAESTKTYMPEIDITYIYNAEFIKFLYIDPKDISIAAFNEIEVDNEGNITSKLITSNKSKNNSITRIKEHVRVTFTKKKQDIQQMPYDVISALEGICFDIQPDKIYGNLVPFGPSFQNVKSPISITEHGAFAYVNGSSIDLSLKVLGSPFVLDASFHIACAWGQRFTDIIPFPVGFEKRYIYNLTKSNENYYSRIIPVKITTDNLIFNVWIYDLKGILCEAIIGLCMKDVSSGKLRPPEWIKENDNYLKEDV